MLKKTIGLVFDVKKKKKGFTDSITNDKKTFEKEMDTLKINKKIGPELLFGNIRTLADMLLYAAPVILLVYEWITGKLGKKKNIEDTISDEVDTANTEIADATSGISNDLAISSHSFTDDPLAGKVSEWHADSKNNLDSVTGKISDSVAVAETKNNDFVETLSKEGGEVNIDTNVTGNELEYGEKLAALSAIDLSGPAKSYVDAVGVALNDTSSDIDNILVPAYEGYAAVLGTTIDHLNQIFSIAPLKDVVERNIEELTEWKSPNDIYLEQQGINPNSMSQQELANLVEPKGTPGMMNLKDKGDTFVGPPNESAVNNNGQ